MNSLGQIWGSAVAERRQRLGLSQAELAKLCDVTQQTISKIESGSMIPLDRLKLVLAARLGTKPERLFTWPSLAEIDLEGMAS